MNKKFNKQTVAYFKKSLAILLKKSFGIQILTNFAKNFRKKFLSDGCFSNQ